MTFDEAFEELEPRTIWSSEMRDLLEQLRQEYAPTVEMTKWQYGMLVVSLNNTINRVDKVGIFEFMSLYSLLNQEIDHLSLMQAWLHPETIKIIDE